MRTLAGLLMRISARVAMRILAGAVGLFFVVFSLATMEPFSVGWFGYIVYGVIFIVYAVGGNELLGKIAPRLVRKKKLKAVVLAKMIVIVAFTLAGAIVGWIAAGDSRTPGVPALIGGFWACVGATVLVLFFWEDEEKRNSSRSRDSEESRE
jgi:hypothetical protein